MSQDTPLMQQFQEFKLQHPDAILFLRCGDFYEMFHEDAKIASRELSITLTSRNKTSENPIPMAGVPYHAYEEYAAKLIRKGYKIAICEQIEDPKEVKGIVKRAVTQVLTPGTVTLSGVLNPHKNNFLASLYSTQKNLFLAYIDVSTGQAFCSEIILNKISLQELSRELVKIEASEILVHKNLYEEKIILDCLLANLIEKNLRFQKFEAKIIKTTPLFDEWVSKPVLMSSQIKADSGFRMAFEMLFSYMETCHIDCEIASIQIYNLKEQLLLDPHTIRNLELTTTLYENKEELSLFGLINKTMTASGARLLKQFLLAPLTDKKQIEDRLNFVTSMTKNPLILKDLRVLLGKTHDLYRLANRLVNQSANARDLIAIATTLEVFPSLITLLSQLKTTPDFSGLKNLESLKNEILNAIVSDPPAKVTEGGLIRDGFNQNLDQIRNIEKNGDQILLDIENQEKENSGIKALKIRYHRIFGFYIEIPRSQSQEVPQNYIRKQTLANVERFTTEKLQIAEKQILEAKDSIQTLEYEIFCQLRVKILKEIHTIQTWAGWISYIDVIAAFANQALENQYCRPLFCEENKTVITEGRHPLVESQKHNFVPNDLILDEAHLIHLITGPNMGGKSTYLRQIALMVILAQMGSFVPASFYESRIFDRIFTRVGASDDLGGGKSTFMVEMSETAHLLLNASQNSLILLDEIGRGTATYDGLALAWSVVEYILQHLGCFTLFATHYHELVQINRLDARVTNYCVGVLEAQGEILFTHKIQRGSASKSYGIHVAKLAGMPKPLLLRANQILKDLEDSKSAIIGLDTKSKKLCFHGTQKSLLETTPKPNDIHPLIEKLKNLDINSLSPIQALNVLFDLKEDAQKIHTTS